MKPSRKAKRRAMRCVYCESLQTVRHGTRTITAVSYARATARRVMRYRCRACGRSFSLRRERGKRYSASFKLEVARMHVEERMSYRVMAKRLTERFGLRVTAQRLCTMVNEVAACAKGSLAIVQEFHPQWSGYLLIDDKYVSVRGARTLSLMAADKTGDPVHSELIVEPVQGTFTAFLRFIVERLAYPLKALTSDFDERFAKALEALAIGPVLHQRCQWHGMQTVKHLLNHYVLRRKLMELERRFELYQEQEAAEGLRTGGRRTVGAPAWLVELEVLRQEYARQVALLQATEAMLNASVRASSREAFAQLRRRYGQRYPPVIAWLEKNLELMLAHQEDPLIPKTNNIAENLNKQLERRFKTIEAFQSVETAWNYQTLLRNYLRFKPYTDCKGARRIYNGLSPLEVCGVQLPHRDWLKQVRFGRNYPPRSDTLPPLVALNYISILRILERPLLRPFFDSSITFFEAT